MTIGAPGSLRIAYTPSGGASWAGGLTYQKNLLAALKDYAPGARVFILSEKEMEQPGPGENFSYVKYPSDRGAVHSLISKLTVRFAGRDHLLARTIKSIPGGGADIVFPGRLKAGRGVAVLYWIPDFQHRHLPEMYSPSQISSLDLKFRKGAENSTLVLLSSRDAEKDFRDFAPEMAGKGRVMNFVAHIPRDLYSDDAFSVTGRYHLPEKFFYLPNQFWKHKNHIAVFEAMKILKEKGIAPFIVFTGNPVDSRNPLHFAELIQKLSEWGLRDQAAFLGLVPHDDVYRLIRQSVCVLNPSFFEGWSTTVEEAKSVGKRVLLSNLSVHREQDPPDSEYFDPSDPGELAVLMEKAWTGGRPGPDPELEEKARRAYPERMKRFAETFVSIAAEAVELERKR
ncbi:MAG TPA: glycosyltransferase family 1 protein [Acidobacteriota bacterium]|nr:glycosyltransferase family 1 protein [Acidobacteriota bacterium]